MATHKRRNNHTSCRFKGNKKLKKNSSNSPRQVQIAKLNWERWGILVGRPKGHKTSGWYAFPDRKWSPLDEKLKENFKDGGGVPAKQQRILLRGR